MWHLCDVYVMFYVMFVLCLCDVYVMFMRCLCDEYLLARVILLFNVSKTKQYLLPLLHKTVPTSIQVTAVDMCIHLVPPHRDSTYMVRHQDILAGQYRFIYHAEKLFRLI